MRIHKIFPVVVLAIISIAIVSSCASGSGDDNDTSIDKLAAKNGVIETGKSIASDSQNVSKKLTYNFYIDNSGSMNFFIAKKGNSPTQYQKCVTDFIYKLFNTQDTYNFWAFATGPKFIKTAKNLIEVEEALKIIVPGSKCGDTHNTNNIINTAVDTFEKNNITVIISDFIFTSQDPVVKAALSGSIMDRLNVKLNIFDFSSLILKFHATTGKETKPFYILIIGDENKINDILQYFIHRNSNEYGYEDFCKLSNPEKTVPMKLNYSQEGYYETDFDHQGASNLIMKEAHPGDNNCFKCSFKINMENFPFSPDYLDNPNNYFISNNYKIAIKTLTDDKSGFTHNIELSTNNFNKGLIEISLRNKTVDSFILSNQPNDIPTIVNAFTASYKQRFKNIYINQAFSNIYYTKTIKIK